MPIVKCIGVTTYRVRYSIGSMTSGSTVLLADKDDNLDSESEELRLVNARCDGASSISGA